MKIRTIVALSTAAAVVGLVAPTAQAQQLSNNLFSQYETPQGASTTTAGMYPAPHFVPGYVGASYYTYQPLQPHEMMYTHSRNYYNPYAGPDAFYADQCGDRCGANGGSGFNVTTVKWMNGCTHMGPLPCSIQPFAGLLDHMARHRYCHRPGQRGFRGHGLKCRHCHGAGCGHCGGHRLLGRHRGYCADGTCADGSCVTGEYQGEMGTQSMEAESNGASATLSDEGATN